MQYHTHYMHLFDLIPQADFFEISEVGVSGRSCVLFGPPCI